MAKRKIGVDCNTCCAAIVFLNFILCVLPYLHPWHQCSFVFNIAIIITIHHLFTISLAFAVFLNSVIYLHHLAYYYQPLYPSHHLHLILSTLCNASQHWCQHTNIYTSSIFLICVFLLVGNAASFSLTPSHLGIFLNLPCRHWFYLTAVIPAPVLPSSALMSQYFPLKLICWISTWVAVATKNTYNAMQFSTGFANFTSLYFFRSSLIFALLSTAKMHLAILIW